MTFMLEVRLDILTCRKIFILPPCLIHIKLVLKLLLKLQEPYCNVSANRRCFYFQLRILIKF